MMSKAVAKYLPEARVLGELRDQTGILIRVQVHNVDAASLSDIQSALQKAGASGWHWTAESESILKIRVYFQRRHIVKYAVVAAIGFVLWWQYNDVLLHHFGFATSH